MSYVELYSNMACFIVIVVLICCSINSCGAPLPYLCFPDRPVSHISRHSAEASHASSTSVSCIFNYFINIKINQNEGEGEG